MDFAAKLPELLEKNAGDCVLTRDGSDIEYLTGVSDPRVQRVCYPIFTGGEDSKILVVAPWYNMGEIKEAYKERKGEDLPECEFFDWYKHGFSAGITGAIESGKDGEQAEYFGIATAIGNVMNEYGLGVLCVPHAVPAGLVGALEELGYGTETQDLIKIAQFSKDPDEVDAIKQATLDAEKAMSAAFDMLREATIEGDKLTYGGEDFTIGMLREKILSMADEMGYEYPEGSNLELNIGPDSYGVYVGDSSTVLQSRKPIFIDIFWRDKETKLHTDMTRMVCVGEPDETVKKMFKATQEALEAGIAAMAPGVNGWEVDKAMSDVLQRYDIHTTRMQDVDGIEFDPDVHIGQMDWGTGHGTGRKYHDGQPYQKLSPIRSYELQIGDVFAVEPGVRSKTHGQVRLEVIGVVTEDGYEVLGNMPIEPVIIEATG